jgi:4-hydroxy-L-threonine phosphate dehydrogenase PdxA
MCVPIIFASNKTINFYRKSLPDINFNYQSLKDFTRINPKQINVFNCWEEEVNITPGQLNDLGGKYALKSLQEAVKALKDGNIQGLVTAPIHKSNIQSESFKYNGHTPYLNHEFNVKDVLMILTAENMKVALVTEHETIADVTKKNY